MKRVSPALYSALATLAVGCSGPTQAVAPPETVVHLNDEWFRFRGRELGISEDAARARDEALSEDEPPEEETFDRSTRVEAAAVWTQICAPCHGKNGDPEGVPEAAGARPRKWGGFGVRMGFFFGGDGMRAGIYRKIKNGVTTEDGQPTLMRSFAAELSREQIWALVRHIEGF